MRISDWSSDVCSSDLTQGGNGAAPRIFQTMNNWQDPAIDAYEPATAGVTEMRDIDILDPLDQGQAEQPLLARPFDKHQRAHKLKRLFLLAATMLLVRKSVG